MVAIHGPDPGPGMGCYGMKWNWFGCVISLC
jgi:hypothetical protein